MTGQITVLVCLSYSDLVVGVVAHPGCDAQKPGGSSLPYSIANAKFTSLTQLNTVAASYLWSLLSHSLATYWHLTPDLVKISKTYCWVMKYYVRFTRTH